MRRRGNIVLLGCFGTLLAICTSAASAGELSATQQEGKALTLEFCQACHQYAGTEQAGTVAPPLVGMKSRFPKRQTLFDIIYDPHKQLSKDTMMPPFGRNELLAREQIDKIIEFLYTL